MYKTVILLVVHESAWLDVVAAEGQRMVQILGGSSDIENILVCPQEEAWAYVEAHAHSQSCAWLLHM